MAIYSNEELRSIQLIELDVLREIISICKILSIEYFVIGGTCLGAARHHGFIPWDDDIDLGMRRKDYDIFLEKAPALLPKKYFLQTPVTDRNSPYTYAKVRVEGTEFIEYCNRKVDMHKGIYCDIFPFDEVPDDEMLNIKQHKSFTRVNNVFFYRQTPDVFFPPRNIFDKLKSIVRLLYHFFLKITTNREMILSRLKRISEAYNGTGQSALANLNFPRRKTEYIRITDLYPLKQMLFEDLRVNVPKNTDEYLKTHFGDWTLLPPPDQQVGHKPYRVSF